MQVSLDIQTDPKDKKKHINFFSVVNTYDMVKTSKYITT